jgi:chemotaxis protein methyltransferase CheR
LQFNLPENKEANTQISDIFLSQFSKFLTESVGLYFPKERLHDLRRKIHLIAQDFGFKDVETGLQWLMSSSLTRNQIEILASHLTVGETYFFRENNTFEILEKHILLEIINSRQENNKQLRIWSAGCCTGEEPYSIAILLYKMIPDLQNWNITILATDINPQFIKKAEEGVYSKWSFRDTPNWVKEKYFKKLKEDKFEILANIKNIVKFSYLNLAEDNYPSLFNNTNAMDIIFCRNVLMYFSPERVKNVVHRFYLSLVNNGWLIVSPTEISSILYPQFTSVRFSDVILYRKSFEQFYPEKDFDKVFLPPSTFETQFNLTSQTQQEVLQGNEEEILEKIQNEFFNQDLAKQTQNIQLTEYEKALVLYKQGRYNETIEKLIEIFTVNQQGFNDKLISLLLQAFANTGKLTEAKNWCEKALAFDKLNPYFYYLLANIQQEEGQAEQAEASLKCALYIDQNFVLAHFALGNLSRSNGKIKESDKYFKNAISLLDRYQQEEVLPYSEGITVKRLTEIIQVIISI